MILFFIYIEILLGTGPSSLSGQQGEQKGREHLGWVIGGSRQADLPPKSEGLRWQPVTSHRAEKKPLCLSSRNNPASLLG